ncbi:MAG TPA: SUMF1/EgtB/PvdO family nonheme iron enzyme [Terriglobales bacterium]|nr:SUMF1/EgtB/PvdO family nonheme iron enzyme [Terriglobales bacterium]
MSGPRTAIPVTEPSRQEPQLVLIPAGWFAMGSETGQDTERPVHRVWIDSFYLSECQITNAEYADFLKATGKKAPPLSHDLNFNQPEQPVVSVSWFEAVKYCEWLSGVSGRKYRLPTEAEWEHASRGGPEGKLFPWGDDPPQSQANYAERWKTGPEPVRRSSPNGFGLYDICQNVHEWCSDWFQPDYYAHSAERNPQGPDTGRRRASRGGSWRHHIKVTRCAARSSIPPEFQYADYGFRVACDVS